MTVPLPKTDVDWTALRNFAALRGQLRVSLTPVCNLKCWFCHNEGDVPPPFSHLHRDAKPRARELTADDYVNVLRELIGAGLKRVYFTGGEPLASKLARPVLTQLPVHGPDVSYTLITNGLLVRSHQDWLATTGLDKVKVSLHYFSDESFRAIARTRAGIATVADGIAYAGPLSSAPRRTGASPCEEESPCPHNTTSPPRRSCGTLRRFPPSR